MSRRLSLNEKARILEQSNPELVDLPVRFLNDGEDKEFYEGMASGLLLAVEIINQQNNQLNAQAGEMIVAVMAKCIRHSDNI